MTASHKVRAGHYLVTGPHLDSGEVELAYVPGLGWVTRSPLDPRVTFEVYTTKKEAIADLQPE